MRLKAPFNLEWKECRDTIGAYRVANVTDAHGNFVDALVIPVGPQHMFAKPISATLAVYRTPE